jgi:hypothetical protein
MVVAGPGPVRKSHYDWMGKQPRRGEISGGARSVPALGSHGENLGPIPNAIKKAGAISPRRAASTRKEEQQSEPGRFYSRWRALVLGCVPPAVGGLSNLPGRWGRLFGVPPANAQRRL